LPLPDLAAGILGQIDGTRSLAEIHANIETGAQAALGWESFKSQFDRLYGSFYGLSRMFLRRPV